MMNRRGFFASLAGLAAGLLLPKAANPLCDLFAPLGTMGHVDWKCYTRPAILNEGWVCIMHPDCVRDITTLQAREKWKDAYRAWRIDGKPAIGPRELLAKYAVKSSELYHGELGTVGGFRIIQQELVKTFTV